ncbi:hypothetical protein K488DRAFT_82951 [Vararia minispora EC-137]|uniref:Uncharacterized protein n=1 Tax=Vararia minispora EC-137 TaxID=1314806 RepID=A0ACB8QUZ0_9AGAM|nr:hypothetical protein K488DRAFT_82951 [Vararia minispora EC-137]
MAAPTQQYPPWLTVVSTVFTNAAGEPTATSSIVLNLPLTYYGPPIDLGTDGAWVYGGLTSPPSTPSTFTTVSPTLTTSATPSLSPTPSSVPTFLPSSSSIPSPSSSTSFVSSSVTAVASSSASNHPLIIGLVVGIVGGFAVLFAIVGLFICCRRRPRPESGHMPVQQVSPTEERLWEEWPPHTHGLHDANAAEAARVPGEGSPRGSGEEHDPFLRASAIATDGAKEADPSARLVGPSQARSPSGSSSLPFGLGVLSWGRRKPPPVSLDEKEGSGSTSYVTAADGSREFTNTPPQPVYTAVLPRDRHIVPPRELVRAFGDAPPSRAVSPRHTQVRGLDDEDTSYDDVGVPLLPPQVAVDDPNRRPSNRSLRSGGTSVSEGVEGATVLTARRVHMDEHYMPRTPHFIDDQHLSTSQRWAQAVNLRSFPNLGRNSWVHRMLHGRASPNGSRSRPTSVTDRAMSPVFDADLNLDIEGLHHDPLRRETGMLDPRPISSVSAKSAASGATVFYDASSRIGTPVNDNTASMGTSNYRPSPLRSDSLPPAYEAMPPLVQPPAIHSASTPAIRSPSAPAPADVLDMPIPRPASPFTTASNATATARMPLPPGLAMPNISAWRNSDRTSNTGSGSGHGEITIDVLEEAPPAAGESWSLLRRTGPDAERRTTFGSPTSLAQPQLTVSRDNVYAPSHYPSLHSSPTEQSLPTHLRAPGSGSTGSRSGSSGQHSHEQSGSSGRTGSVSSQGQRRLAAGSPPLSAVGEARSARVSDVSSADHATRPLSAGSTPVSATVGSAGTAASVTTHGSVRDARTGEVMRFPYVPHTAGLAAHAIAEDRDKESEGWGGSWGGPDHLRALQATGSDESGYAE